MLPTGHSSLEVDVLPTFLKAGVLIKVHSVEGHFIDIGTPASLPDAAEFVRRHVENIRP
jgi:NDP-sugar pyrophosphorylase family protein